MKRGEDNVQRMLKRLFPSASSGDMEAAGERVLGWIRAQLPECVEAFRFFPAAGQKAEPIRSFDLLVMTAVYLLGNDASCLRINEKVEELTLRRSNLGAVYVSLDCMKKQGLVSSQKREDGGRVKSFFKLTERGERVFAKAEIEQQAVEDLGHIV